MKVMLTLVLAFLLFGFPSLSSVNGHITQQIFLLYSIPIHTDSECYETWRHFPLYV